MAISEKLKTFLDGSRVKYTAAKHSIAYTAQEIAATQHVPGRQLAKCVLVNSNVGPVLAVLPAIHLIDLKKLKALIGAKRLTIAKESDMKQRFPDVEVGAMSPFGDLYQVPVVVDQELGESEEIVFNAGSHTDTIKMRYGDFSVLVKPKVGAFGQRISSPRTGKTKSKPKKGGKTPAAARSKRSRPKATLRARTKKSRTSSRR